MQPNGELVGVEERQCEMIAESRGYLRGVPGGVVHGAYQPQRHLAHLPTYIRRLIADLLQPLTVMSTISKEQQQLPARQMGRRRGLGGR